jgi:hypothetical protein
MHSFSLVYLSSLAQLVQWQAELAHPMRLHWEYLSYLFRKLPALSANEELERGYRDFLQVIITSPEVLP